MPTTARMNRPNWFPVGEVVTEFAPSCSEPGQVQALAASLHQFVSCSLEGPKGVDPATLIAALGALAGYSARFVVREGVRQGLYKDDFSVPRGVNARHVSMSDRVTALVCDLTQESYVATMATGFLAKGGQWLPDVRQDLMHNFMAINAPTYPDYTVASSYLPKIPPQTLLLMLWDQLHAKLSVTEHACEHAMQAFGLATVAAADAVHGRMPLHVSAQLATETAIAM